MLRRCSRRSLVVIGAMGLLAAGVVIGIALQYFHLPGKVRSLLVPPPPQASEAEETGGDPVERTAVARASLKGKRVMVALAFGQSNSANSGDVRHASGDNVFNFYLGRIYKARDPLLGATADGGSVWTRLGDMIVDSKTYDAVIFATIGVGRSTIRRWAPEGDLHPVLIYTLRDLRRHGLPPTHLLWHQGESDHLTSTGSYKSRFQRMLLAIRQEEPKAPLFVSIASKREDRTYGNVQRAQAELIDPEKGIYPGPNTDTLGDEWRNSTDHVHFNERGLWKCAELWLEALRAVDGRR